MGKAKKLNADRRAKEAERLLESSPFDEWTPRWRSAQSGHHWVDTERGRMLAPIDKLCLDVCEFAPLRVNGLPIIFGGLDPTEDAFRHFANKYGLLTIQTPTFEPGELWVWWKNAWTHLRNAVDLWQGIGTGDVSERIRPLGPVKIWTGGKPREEWKWLHHRPGEPRGMIASISIAENDSIAAAKRFLQRSINSALEKHAGVRILWHPEEGKFLFRIMPRDLYGAMWWQLGKAFTGSPDFKECPVCHKPFPVGPGGFKATMVYCSTKCRVHAHRHPPKPARRGPNARKKPAPRSR